MLKWLQTNVTVPEMAPSKDPADDPIFRHAKFSRWVWRVYTQRLTPAGRWFALLSAGFVSYSGAGFQLQGYVLGAYMSAIWFVALLGFFIWKPRVSIYARLPDRACAGETIEGEVEVTNHSGWRGADLVLLPNRLPREVDAIPGDGVSLPDMKAGGKVLARIKLLCKARGVFELKGFRVESGFPFGVMRSRRIFWEKRRLVVYPQFQALSRLALPTGRRFQPGGVALASQLGESFEYLGNREFREGDNVRDIDWRATARVGMARGGTPIVREWVEEYMLRVAVILDTQIPTGLSKKETAIRREGFERAVSLAAGVSDYMARQDYLVDLFAAGPNLYHLTAGRSLAYLEQILDILACVGESAEAPFEVIEPQLSEVLERISTAILVLMDFDEPRRQFAQSLAERGVAVKLIIVREGSCTLDPALAETGLATALVTPEQVRKGVEEL